MDQEPKISVIIPALNEAAMIGGTLKALSEQTFKDFEVIVVDGGSTDNTREIAGSLGARAILERRRGWCIAQNVGAKASNGDVLFFIDADAVPSKDLLALYANAFSDSQLVAAGGPIKPLEKSGLKIRLAYKFYADFAIRLSILVGIPYLMAPNFAIRSQAFKKVHGFNEAMNAVTELDLCRRLKPYGRFRFLGDASVSASTRRIAKWGIIRSLMFTTKSMLRYARNKEVNIRYDAVR